MNSSTTASLTMAQIASRLAQAQVSDEDLASLANDSRTGVQRLVATYRRKQSLLAKENEHRIRMLAHEAQARRDGFRLVCGIDEAGRGPLAGPVVAAAVIFAPDSYIGGVNDSKKLSPARREALHQEIMAQATDVGVGSCSAEEIDEYNILRATHLAMRRAIDGLRQRPDLALVDGLPVSGLTCTHRAIVGGDASSFVIAAASIIAKVTRDRLMDEFDLQYPGYGFAQHKGYGTPQHLDALRERGPCPLHRLSFTLTGTSLF